MLLAETQTKTLLDQSTLIFWAEFIKEYGAMISHLIIGLIVGMVLMLLVQRKGWISNPTQVESAKTIARLETHVTDLEEKMEALLLELKPWRRFQEQRLEEFFYSNKNSLKE